MTLTNHLLTGTLLAKVLPLPIAIPLALISHFVLDALPHFGYSKADAINVIQRHKKAFGFVISMDLLLTLIVSTWLIGSHHTNWILVGLVAYSPDLFWIYRFSVEEKFGKQTPTKGNYFVQFHRNIQWCEQPWGIFVEAIYGLAILFVLR